MFDVWKGLKYDDYDSNKKTSRIIQYTVIQILDGVKLVRAKIKIVENRWRFLVLFIYRTSLDYIIETFFFYNFFVQRNFFLL